MCILFLAIDAHPDHCLIVAANRDEYFSRPSEPMHYWPDQPDTLAGRDMLAGGTWLGLNRSGNFAAVTNFRLSDSHREDAFSRGLLVSRFLDDPNPEQFTRHLDQHHARYNPFNLVFGNQREVHAWDHREQSSRILGPGFHSISNGAIDQPWPKMARGVDQLRRYLNEGLPVDDNKIVTMMQDRTRASQHQLPDTGLDVERERSLSSIFIEGTEYGTRTTTVIRFSPSRVLVSETNYLPGGAAGELQRYTVEPENRTTRR